jgi:starch-binding outer membrane protein, SusD/RagB family
LTMIALAEQICPGFPIRDVDASDLDAIKPVFTGAPQTTDSGFVRAIAQFDSSLAYAGDSVYLRDLALVGKARALLGLGRFAEAATVAATVTPGYVGTVLAPFTSIRRAFVGSFDAISVSNHEGGTGLDFVAADDPRLPIDSIREASFGPPTTLYAPTYHAQTPNPDIVVASDVEAQLIQAEAQLQPADNPSGPWLATLNALRATVALPDTTDPGTAAGRVNLLFRERAFWLFGTAHRLGDVRRLIARYGRDPETVFPTGAHRMGGNYSTATSIPFDGTYEHTFNPAITGCLSR